MDKNFWRAVIESDYAVPEGHSAREFIPELVSYLGSTDSELRDTIADGILVRWVDRRIFTPRDLHPLVAPLAENLTKGIGEQNTDTVFLRAFSVLILAAIVYYDNHKQPFLTEPEVRTLFDQALAYFAAEKDLRGHVPQKGWAHSCAHTSDLLDEFALHRFITASDLLCILKAFADKVMAPSGCIYLYNEDDRMSYAVLSALKRQLLRREQVAEWLAPMAELRERLGGISLFTDPGCQSTYLNTRNFLRSLYIRLADDELPEPVRALGVDVWAALRKMQYS